jgi:D-cysteine desulfhydrase
MVHRDGSAGLALGANLLKLPFRVVGVMLAGKQAYYDAQTDKLLAEFGHTYGLLVNSDRIPLTWIDRPQPRKFGDVLPGEIEQCSRIARKHGVLLDPVYSLAAWEVAAGLAAAGHPNVAMLHAGGSLGLQSLAQRFPSDF